MQKQLTNGAIPIGTVSATDEDLRNQSHERRA